MSQNPERPEEQRLSKVEQVKANSEFLREPVGMELASDSTKFSEEGTQILKFHGIYQQDDRDLRKALLKEGKDRDWSFMVRLKLPGGILTSEQYLRCDELASTHANRTLRITTRQDFQFHGVVKKDLKPVLASIDESLMTTFGGCGDVSRNVMSCPAPEEDMARSQMQQHAAAISQHLLPKTGAYHEIWVDGERVSASDSQEEPLYGSRYLPRKFKIGMALRDDNCVDVYSQDIGLVADVAEGQLRGFNVLVGGGLGMTHKNPMTYPRLASPMAYVSPERVLETVEAIVSIQRDNGNRSDRKRARMKYLVEEWGVSRFTDEVEQRLGHRLEPARAVGIMRVDDHLGWHAEGNDRSYLGVFVENGRIEDTPDQEMKTAFRRLATEIGPLIRLTPQQNLLLSAIPNHRRNEVNAILQEHGVSPVEEISNALRNSMACPALPTCGLAVAESERVLPRIIREFELVIRNLDLDREHISFRMTGCPNGCARPYIGDIGIVGRTQNAYVIFLGGDFEGTRLNQEFADLVPGEDLVDTLVPILSYFKEHRKQSERFGDFCHRIGVRTLQEMFPRGG